METTRSTTLRSRGGTGALFAVLSAFFTLGGAWMIARQAPKGWFVTVFFGLCTVAFCLTAIPGVIFIRLTTSGFTFSSLTGVHTYRWSEVETFRAKRIASRRQVVFSLRPASKRNRFIRWLNLADYHVAIPPANFGSSVEELAGLLNTWRRRALSRPAKESGQLTPC